MKKIIALACAVLLFVSGCATVMPESLPIETTAAVNMEVPATTVQTEPIETEQTEATLPIPDDDTLVCVNLYAPQIRVELAYATDGNFTGKVIYEFKDAYLRYGTLKKLVKANEALCEHGVGILIWDGFRPVSAQAKLWEVCPDPKYVSHPVTGKRAHCRGNAVDVTLYDLQTGALIEMPTGFDDFSKRADRDYRDCSATQKKNALLLENIMKENGFKPYSAEWWHFTDRIDYPVEETFDPTI